MYAFRSVPPRPRPPGRWRSSAPALLAGLVAPVVLAGCTEPTTTGRNRDTAAVTAPVTRPGSTAHPPSTRPGPSGGVRCLGAAVAFELLVAEPQAFALLPPSDHGVELFRRHIVDVGGLMPPEAAPAFAQMAGVLDDVADLWSATAAPGAPPKGDDRDPARQASARLERPDALDARRAVERRLDEACTGG